MQASLQPNAQPPQPLYDRWTARNASIKALSKKAAIEQKKAADCLSSVILVALVVYSMTVETLKEHPRKIINRN